MTGLLSLLPRSFQGELKHGGPAAFSVVLLHVSHLDSDQCSELRRCLPNAFQNIFFSLIAEILKSCQGV